MLAALRIALESVRLPPNRRVQVVLIVLAGVLMVAADHVYDHVNDVFFPGGPLDETAHITTAYLILLLLPRWVRDHWFWPAMVGSFIIDVDHVPAALGDDFLTVGTPRPYTHSLLTLVVLLGIALLWKRHRNLVLGFAFGIALHFFRDLAEGGQGGEAGVTMLWPVSHHVFRYPHAIYLWLMAAVFVADLAKTACGRLPTGRPVTPR